MRLGSHNSMSYLKPKKWYYSLLRFCYRNQSLNIEKQLMAGVTYFDLRVRYENGNELVFAHGITTFKHCSFTGILELIESTSHWLTLPIVVKVTLERDKFGSEREEMLFRNLCSYCEHRFTELVFVGGSPKYDWGKKIYNFQHEDTSIHCYESAKRPTIYPLLHAKFKNKQYLSKYKRCDDNTIVVLDFVQLKLNANALT